MTHPVATVLFDMEATLVDADAAVERSRRARARRWGVERDLPPASPADLHAHVLTPVAS